MKSFLRTIQIFSILILSIAIFFTFCKKDEPEKGKGLRNLLILNQLSKSSAATTESSGTTITIPQGLGQ